MANSERDVEKLWQKQIAQKQIAKGMLRNYGKFANSERDVEKLWQKQWNGKIFYSHGTTSSRGVFITLKKNLEFKLLSPEICDPQGHTLF